MKEPGDPRARLALSQNEAEARWFLLRPRRADARRRRDELLRQRRDQSDLALATRSTQGARRSGKGPDFPTA